MTASRTSCTIVDDFDQRCHRTLVFDLAKRASSLLAHVRIVGAQHRHESIGPARIGAAAHAAHRAEPQLGRAEGTG